MLDVSFTGKLRDKWNNHRKNSDKKAEFAGYMAGGAASTAVGAGSFAVMPYIKKMSTNLTPEVKADLFESAKEALKRSGVADKVSIKTVNEESLRSINSYITAAQIDSLSLPKALKEQIKNLSIPEYAAATGSNAFFTGSKVLYNPDKMGLSAFHEIGHGMNRHASKIGKALQSVRTPAMALPALILMIALGTKSKSRENYEAQNQENAPKKGFMANIKNKFHKCGAFVRDNAGKLSFASMLPIMIEEGMASYKGQKLAKQLLSPEMFKKVKINNALALSTYVLAGVAAGVGAWTAVKVKDHLVAKKLAKQNPQQPNVNA